MMDKATVYEKVHRINQWVSGMSALLILMAQFLPVLTDTEFNIAVAVLAGTVLLSPILRSIALDEAFASLGFNVP
jgi:hypothetical protein